MVADNNPFQMADAYFTNAIIYYQTTNSRDVLPNALDKNNNNSHKPRKLKVKHGVKPVKGKSALLLESVTQDYVLPLARLSGAQIDPYWTPSIFLPESLVRTSNHPGLV